MYLHKLGSAERTALGQGQDRGALTSFLENQDKWMPLWSTYKLCTTPGEQTEGKRRLSAGTRLWFHWDHRDAVGLLAWLKCCSRWGQALQEGQTRKARQRMVLYGREQQKCTGLCLGMDNEPVKNLWVRTGEDIKMGNYWGCAPATDHLVRGSMWV